MIVTFVCSNMILLSLLPLSVSMETYFINAVNGGPLPGWEVPIPDLNPTEKETCKTSMALQVFARIELFGPGAGEGFVIMNQSKPFPKKEMLMRCPYNPDVFSMARFYITVSNFPFLLKQLSMLAYPGEVQCRVSGDDPQCTGISACKTDECGCHGNPVVHCPLGPGCIPFDQVCDGVPDCEGGSEECLCEGVVEVRCLDSREFRTCMSPDQICRQKKEWRYLNCTGFEITECPDTIGEILDAGKSILASFEYRPEINNYCMGILERLSPSNNTDKIDSSWTRDVCKRVHPGGGRKDSLVYKCGDTTSTLGDTQLTDMDMVCDGRLDCPNGGDESVCPGRFFCQRDGYHGYHGGNVSWVDPGRVCDGVVDCKNGVDECRMECYNGTLARGDYFFRYNSVPIILTLLGGLIIVLSAHNAVKIGRETPEGGIGNVERILKIQIAVCDILTGLYLLAVVVKGWTDGTSYCLGDMSWRSSGYCVQLGCLYSVSNHGSLLLTTSLAVLRFLHNRFSMTVGAGGVSTISGVVGVCITLHALMPLYLEDVFRSEVQLSQARENPFLERFNEERIRSIYNMTHAASPARGSTNIEILERLRDITTKPSIFDYTSIGYYGNNRFCIANNFAPDPIGYKIFYSVILGIILAVLSISHICDLLSNMKQEEPEESETRKFNIPLTILTTTQVATWMSYLFQFGVVYYNSRFNTSDAADSLVHEIVSLFVLPSNGLLNSLCYCGLWGGVRMKVWGVWRKIVEIVNPGGKITLAKNYVQT
eukprot:sb/3462325/